MASHPKTWKPGDPDPRRYEWGPGDVEYTPPSRGKKAQEMPLLHKRALESEAQVFDDLAQ